MVLHRCDNRRCVRPEHLFVGTNRDNMQDMARKHRGAGGSTPGEDNPRAKLTDDQVREIRERSRPGLGSSLGAHLSRPHVNGWTDRYWQDATECRWSHRPATCETKITMLDAHTSARLDFEPQTQNLTELSIAVSN